MIRSSLRLRVGLPASIRAVQVAGVAPTARSRLAEATPPAPSTSPAAPADQIKLLNGCPLRVETGVGHGYVAPGGCGATQMIALPSRARAWFVAGTTDMRRGFGELAHQVRDMLQLDGFSGHQFVFRNERGDLLRSTTVQTQPVASPRWSRAAPPSVPARPDRVLRACGVGSATGCSACSGPGDVPAAPSAQLPTF